MSSFGREAYEVWSDPSSPWSAWAKPALFATYMEWPTAPTTLPPYPQTAWAPAAGSGRAVIVDLPDSVLVGLALAEKGFRPVPLFNGCAAPGMIVDVTAIANALYAGTDVLRRLSLSPDAPPVFLLDSMRRPDTGRASPGRFDNRWVVFPQDFPSARRLAAGGISGVTLFSSEVRPDLAHVLLRYQEAGLELTQAEPGAEQVRPLHVDKPKRFREVGFRAALLVGLLRNPAGGFGGRVPHPSSGG